MRAFWFAAPLLLMAAVACTDDGAPTATPEASPTFVEPTPFVDDLCPLLPAEDVLRTTGYALLEAQPHNAEPFHFCTLYLDIPECEMQCALSLESLGAVDAAKFNSPSAFRDSLIAVNPGADFVFRDDVFGANSWLATAQAGELPQWKVVYFQVNDVAFDLHSPLVAEYPLTEQQVIDVTNAVIGHLNQ
jgi:hypothetical protein